MALLMSPPDHLSAHHLFNPWMKWHEEPDRERAGQEWTALKDLLERCGAAVEVMPPHPSAPAMTFTRDLVLRVGSTHVILRNDGPRGDTEPVLAASWMRDRHRTGRWLGRTLRLDGGNVLRRTDGCWLVGLKPDADARSAAWLGRFVRRTLDVPTMAVPLADIRYLHLDTVLADLGGRGWLVYPKGFAHPDLSHEIWRDILGPRPVIEITDDEAADLACNVVVLGDVVIGGRISDRLRHAIETLGLTRRDNASGRVPQGRWRSALPHGRARGSHSCATPVPSWRLARAPDGGESLRSIRAGHPEAADRQPR